jgi:glyceraldehyde 3-phosphate dehydrogenase
MQLMLSTISNESENMYHEDMYLLTRSEHVEMMQRIGINGFGRIGRQVLRAIAESPEWSGIEVVAINGRGDPEQLAHLFAFDSVYGRFSGSVSAEDNGIVVNDRFIAITRAATPLETRWGDFGVDLVVESTGAFDDDPRMRGHLASGARLVIVTSPAKIADATLVYGVNDDTFDADAHQIISAASCTTNCLACVAQVIHEAFGIRNGMATTVHAITNDQVTIDRRHKDPRRARAAGSNIIPTSTGAARLLDVVMPEIAGRIAGSAVRVPVLTGSLLELVVETEAPVDRRAVNEAFQREMATGGLKGALDFTNLPLVSSDFCKDPHSAIVDGELTNVQGDRLLKISAWYDNEWGYSNRVVDLVRLVGSQVSMLPV